jgi:tetratricopeptide (TPR) repeat protein
VLFDESLGGRAEALDAAHEALEAGWWVTVVGPPGVGKTAFARRLVQRWGAVDRGATELSLQGAEADELEVRLGQALGLELRAAESSRRLDLLRRRLEGGRQRLVWLDGPGVEAAAASLDALLCETKTLRVVVCATRPLGLSVERCIALGPLSDDDARRLLELRLRERGAEAAVSAALLRTTGGLPLAIELLAGRLALLGPQATEAGGEAGALGAPLEASIGAAVEALELADRLALERLGACRGVIDAGVAFELVGGAAPLDRLTRLVERSLVQRGPAEGTFHLLGAVASWLRAHTPAERREAVNAAHAAAFATPTPRRPHGRDELAAVGRRRDDLLAAFRWAKARCEAAGVEPIEARRSLLELARTLDAVLLTQGPPSLHREVLVTALAAVSAKPTTEVVDLRLALGRLDAMQGRHGAALEAFSRALHEAEGLHDDGRVGWACAFSAYCERALGRFEAAQRSAARALAQARLVHELPMVAMAEISLGSLALATGSLDEAVGAFTRVHSVGELARAPRIVGLGAGNLAAALLEGDRLDEVEGWLERARASFEVADDRAHLARVAVDRARLAVARGEPDAGARLDSALEQVRAAGSLEGELFALEARVLLARQQGRSTTEPLNALEALASLGDDVSWRGRIERLRGGPAPVLELSADGRAVTLAGRRLDFARRGPLRRILLALAQRHGSGQSLSSHDLREAGWPGDRMRPESAAQRVYMAVKRLRDLGFAPFMHTVDDGYRLDERLRVQWAGQPLPAGRFEGATDARATPRPAPVGRHA